jgi:hypothetical protein
MTDNKMWFTQEQGNFFDRVRNTAVSQISFTHKLITKPAGFGTTEPSREPKARFTRYSKGVNMRAV